MTLPSERAVTELVARLDRLESRVERLLQRLEHTDAAVQNTPAETVVQLVRALPALEQLAAVPPETLRHTLAFLQLATRPELRDSIELLLRNVPQLATALVALPADEVTLDFLIRATQTLGQVIATGAPRAGWFAAWRATRETNIQAALGFALALARGIGECLEQPIKQLPKYTRARRE